ncbi:MAG: inositol monophosphatase family protein [Gemmatimonadales bacterium]
MVSDTARLLQAVDEVATLAGKVALERFRPGIAVEWKGDGSPVTAADRAAEEAAREWIEKRFPGDAIVGEEFGTSGDPSGRRWFLDPIDGTKSFVAGVPLWGTLVAVADGDEVLAGAINCAAAGEKVTAAVSEGCWWNGRRAWVSGEADLARATALVTDPRFPNRAERRRGWERVAERARVVRTWGDCFGYLLVATGRAEVMVDDRMNPWDSACLMPIIEEAGGVLTDWTGRRTAFGGDTIATNAALAGEARRLLGAGS